LYRRYKDRADFVAVYIREAHAADGWSLPSNDRLGISITQHKDYGERRQAAKTCCGSLKMTMSMVVDEIDDRVGIAYSGMPDRLYVIDSRGRVAYKGGRGPFGYKPSEMEQALIMLLMDEAAMKRPAVTPRHGTQDH
jgi:iodothyronine deiodinase-like protein